MSCTTGWCGKHQTYEGPIVRHLPPATGTLCARCDTVHVHGEPCWRRCDCGRLTYGAGSCHLCTVRPGWKATA